MLEEELRFFMQFLNEANASMLDRIYKASYKEIEAVERTRVETFGGPVHIGNVFHNINLLFAETPKMKEEISEHQRLLLGCSILLHDIGRLKNTDNHVAGSYKMIKAGWREYGFEESDFAETVAEIVASHNGIDTDEIIHKSRFIRFFRRTVNYGVCCVLLRLADELDCTVDRTHPSMENHLIKVRLRQSTPGIEFDSENKSIKISIRPTDICVWNWIPNYERYLNNMLEKEIIKSTLFPYYAHIKISREKEALIKTSFWTKFIDLDNFKKIDVGFVFGMVGDEPGYATQPAWKGSSYSIWDFLSMISMFTMAKNVNSNTSVVIKHAVMNSHVDSQILEYKNYLNKFNTIIIGSPKMNALSEYILAQIFRVKPFSYDTNKSRKLIRFSWPKKDREDKKANNIPFSSFLHVDVTDDSLYETNGIQKVGIYYGTEKNVKPLAYTEFPQNSTEEKPDCGLIVIAKRFGYYHIILSGISGPSTLASSLSLCECDSCYVLEKEEILRCIENENRSVFVFVSVNVTKNNNDPFIDRTINSYSITNVWCYDSAEKTMEEIKLKD